MSEPGSIGILHLRQSSGGGGGADTVLRQILLAGKDRPNLRFAVAYLHKPAHDVASLTEPLEGVGLAVHDIPGRAWLDRGQIAALSALITEKGIRIVHSHDVKSDMLALLLRRRHAGLKIVATLHGWTARTWKGRLYERLDQWVLRRFDRVIAVSEATKRRAERGGVSGAVVMPNALDLTRWRPVDRDLEAPFTVGFVGRLSLEKNPLGVVEVAKRAPSLKFRIAGDGPEAAALEEATAETGLKGRIERVGQVAPDDLPSFYATLDAVVSTSRTEGLPMNLLEAGAMELPVAATDVGGVAELVIDGETGQLVPFGDWDALARALEEFAADRDAARRMGRRARARVEEAFSLSGAMNRLEEIYLAVI